MTRSQLHAEVERRLRDGTIHRYIRRYCRDHERRKELRGELVRKLYELDDEQVSDIRSVDAYITTVARHLAIDFTRKDEGSLLDYRGNHEDVDAAENRTQSSLSDETESDLFPTCSHSAEESVSRAELKMRRDAWLMAAIEQLSPMRRAALILRLYGYLDNAEGARVLGCAKRTFEKHVTDALEDLRQILKQQSNQPYQGGSSDA